METNELVKALRDCTNKCDCATCEYRNVSDKFEEKFCFDVLMDRATNLIEKQERQIQTLKAELSAMEQDLRRAVSGQDGCQFCAHFCNDGKPVYRPDEEYLAYCEKCDGDCCCFEWRVFVEVELKTTRYAQAVKNCAGVTEEKQMTLW